MKPKFSVIKGGLDIPKIENGRTFVSGSATDTRLMGVIGLELTWDVLKDSRIEKMHQIFYLDCEEYGIESYTEGYWRYACRHDSKSAHASAALWAATLYLFQKKRLASLSSRI